MSDALLGSIVQGLEMTDKKSVTLELLPMPHSLSSCSNRFELESRLGAGRSLNSNPVMAFPVLRGQTPLLTRSRDR